MAVVLFVFAVIVVGVVLAALTYFVALQARYPEPAHAHEIHIVSTDDGWKLRLHRRKAAHGGGDPVFFMHSLASNHLNFEVPHGYSLVDYLVNAGYDCWTFDSRACRDAMPPRRNMRSTSTVDDMLVLDIPAALRCIREVCGKPRVHWIGHSMGGMLFYAYDLKFSGEGLASAVTLGSPPGFKGYRHTPHDGIVWLNRRAHTLLSCAFRGLAPYFDFWRPVSRLVPINWDNVHSKLRASELFHAAEMPTPVIGEQMNGWASGKPWAMCHGTLDVESNLHRIATPLLAVFGGMDPFISQRRAREFFDAIENPDKQMIYLSRANGSSANYNHIDLAFARDGEREVFGPILEWLRSHPADGTARRPKTAKRRRAVAKTSPVETKLAAAKPVAKKVAAPRKKRARL
jgi:polyhydroxyalkanoate synthase